MEKKNKMRNCFNMKLKKVRNQGKKVYGTNNITRN